MIASIFEYWKVRMEAEKTLRKISPEQAPVLKRLGLMEIIITALDRGDFPDNFWVGCIQNAKQSENYQEHDVYWQIGVTLMQTGMIDLAVEALKIGYKRNYSAFTLDTQLLIAMLLDPSSSKTELLSTHKTWANRHENIPKKPMFWERDLDISCGPKRVGYVCHFFGASTMNGVAQLIKSHDRSKFEIYAYDDSAEGQEGKPTADHWRKTGLMDDRELAKCIFNDRIDILVELNGVVPGNRYNTFMLRPAPIQINWGNYPGTLGLKCITFAMADPITVPKNEFQYYSEKILHLKHQTICSAYKEMEFPEPSLPPILKNGYPTFGCFAAVHKYNPKVAELWSSVLKEFPDAKLLIKSSGAEHQLCRDNLINLFKLNDIDETRITIRQPSPYNQMLEEYSDIDIVLDTFPATGGSTICEALWMGLPALSLCGDRWCSRQGASILHNTNLEEYIAKSTNDLVNIIKSLLTDLELLKNKRLNQRQKLLRLPFFNHSHTVRQFEQLYEEVSEDLLRNPSRYEKFNYTAKRYFSNLKQYW